jgi:tRNA dimethylallyltransferase
MMLALDLITTPVLILVGPTAIGKTDLSLKVAVEFDCEIISMDSMQVYRFMDIGTAKVSRAERRQVVHHLIDILDPDEQYDAARFVRDALAAIKLISSRGKISLITGGTGLYLSALVNGLFADIDVKDEVRESLQERLKNEGREALHRELLQVDQRSGERIHLNDTQRLLRGLEIYYSTGTPWSEHLRRQSSVPRHPALTRMLHLGLTCDRNLLYDRIKTRTMSMMQDAFKAEVEFLLNRGYPRSLPSMQSIGYRHMNACIAGEWDLNTATHALIQDTRRYAKRQMTWFRRHRELHWYEIQRTDETLAEIDLFIRAAQ